VTACVGREYWIGSMVTMREHAMGVSSLTEDADDRRDEDAHGSGGTVGPAGGKRLNPVTPPRRPCPLARPIRRQKPVSVAERFDPVFLRLQLATGGVVDIFHSFVTSSGMWAEIIEKIRVTRVEWRGDLENADDRHPTYEEYLAVRRLDDDAAAYTEKLFEPGTDVSIALDELTALQVAFPDYPPRPSQSSIESEARDVLDVCYRIQAAGSESESSLDQLIRHPRFDVHFSRYADENW